MILKSIRPVKLLCLIFFLTLCFSCTDNKKNNAPIAVNSRTDTSNRVKPGSSINPYATIDVSPMDMSYFPVEYPKLKMSKVLATPPLARVIYSRPHLQGRSLFHDLLKYEEPWRLGANEATELEFYKDVTIQGQKIKAGRYIIYCLPHPETWTIIFNGNVDTWGLEQDTSKDLSRFTVPVTHSNKLIEYYTMVFQKTATGADLLMAWDSVEARLPIVF